MEFQETKNNYIPERPSDEDFDVQVGGYPETKVGAVRAIQTPANSPSNSESSANYSKTITLLNSGRRLVLCKDGIQWIIQWREGDKWKGKWFARTKQGLIRGILDLVSKGELFGDEAWQAVNSLPAWAHEMAAAWEPSPLREAILTRALLSASPALARAKGEVVHAN